MLFFSNRRRKKHYGVNYLISCYTFLGWFLSSINIQKWKDEYLTDFYAKFHAFGLVTQKLCSYDGWGGITTLMTFALVEFFNVHEDGDTV